MEAPDLRDRDRYSDSVRPIHLPTARVAGTEICKLDAGLSTKGRCLD